MYFGSEIGQDPEKGKTRAECVLRILLLPDFIFTTTLVHLSHYSDVELKLRKVEKLTQSHTVKGRQGPDSHPGVSDSSPGVPLGPQLESLVLRTNVSPPSSLSLVLSPSFLLF